MELFIRQHIKSLGLTYTTDRYGNIYVTKGKADSYPCVVSHIDTVHNLESNLTIVEDKGVWYAYNKDTGLQAGIGGDDKNGIYICLHLLEILDELKVVFFKDEEVGGIGSGQCNLQYFEDVRFIIQNDRRGNNEFIFESGGIELCGASFKEACYPIISKYNYIFSDKGTFTDLNNLKRRVDISMVNMACGYYNAHTHTEYTVNKDLEVCLNINYEICSTLLDEYPHTSMSYARDYYMDWRDWEQNYELTDDPEYCTYCGEQKLPLSLYNEGYEVCDWCASCINEKQEVVKTKKKKR